MGECMLQLSTFTRACLKDMLSHRFILFFLFFFFKETISHHHTSLCRRVQCYKKLPNRLFHKPNTATTAEQAT
uniref:Putative secreted protein n=1 Tax=Anopheles darlingi TaxID=43151 RepID=A0A2M4DIM4_ANODA